MPQLPKIALVFALLFSLIMGLCVCAEAQTPSDDWKIVWSDEFNTDGPPNPKNWTFENGFVRNEENQWYQPENARCENGFLMIEARREKRPNPNYKPGSDDWKTKRETIEYTSSSLLTRGLHQWRYGRFEMRARIDTQPGMWPAFWTLGTGDEWPAGGEIDIMEFYRGMLLANVAWGTEKRWSAKWDATRKPIADFNDPNWSHKFHTWRMDWEENWIRLYVDDQLLNETDLKETINAPDAAIRNPFHQPHYVLLNLAVGGQNGGDPAGTDFPRRFAVDWVRVYQKPDAVPDKTVAPVPTKSALPPLVAPRGWGVNIHFTDPSAGEIERFGEAGYQFARMDFFWGGVEKEKNVYDFSAYDRLYEHLRSVGARPIFILDYGNDLYEKGAPKSEEAQIAFARFAAAAVTHFRNKPVVFEIWNEPNLSGFWPPTANADEYARLAVRAAKAMRQADPNVTIVAPGVSGFAWEFLETVFRSGLLHYIDGVSVHPYRGQNPETVVSDWGKLRALVARYAPEGKKNLPLISSEWGYSTHDGGDISETRQAAYLARMWLSNIKSGVPVSIFYDWRDDGPDPKENEHRFGTVRQDLTPKPSFLAAKQLIASLNGYTFRHQLAGTDKTDWRLLFQKDDTDDLALATWNTGAVDDLPVVRKIAATDSDFAGLRQLATIRWSAGPLALTGTEPVTLPVTVANKSPHAATFAMNVTNADLPGDPQEQAAHPIRLTPGSERILPVPLPVSTLRGGDSQTVRVSLSWNNQPLPALVPITLWRTDPLTISAAPTGNGLRLVVGNPARTALTAQLLVQSGKTTTARSIVFANGEAEQTVTVPVPDTEQPLAVHLLGDKGRELLTLPARRFVPLAPFPDDWQRVRFVENAATPPTPLRPTDLAGDAPGKRALLFDYTFETGWQYATVTPKNASAMPEHARAISLWVQGDGTGNALRARFHDRTGQTFQADLFALGDTEWHAVTIALDGSGPGVHWGGANDGIPHPPLVWDALLLVDSAHRENPKSGQVRITSPYYVVAP